MKLRKKTLLMAGSLSLALGLGFPAHAQTADTATDRIIATTGSDTAPGKVGNTAPLQKDFSANSTPAPARKKIEYKEYKSYADLLKQFPDAKQIVDTYGMRAEDPDEAIVKQSGIFARVTDTLYIYQSIAPDDCGARGCTTITFSVDESGFYPSASILTAMPPPEFEVDQYGEPSVFTCTIDLELIQWKRRDSTEMTGEPVDGENCQRFMSVYEEPKP